MKNLLFISFLLVFQLSFSQVEKNNINFIKTSIFESTIKENSFFSKNTPLSLIPEIKNSKNNSEGKFLLNEDNRNLFTSNTEISATTVMIKNSEKNNSNKLNNNLTSNINKEFVNKIILKKMEAEMKKYISMNEALNYGDRNVDLYRNFDSFKNKLLVTSSITPEIEVQVGKDIYPYLNKILKTELDKTLQNSLNLLVINF